MLHCQHGTVRALWEHATARKLMQRRHDQASTVCIRSISELRCGTTTSYVRRLQNKWRPNFQAWTPAGASCVSRNHENFIMQRVKIDREITFFPNKGGGHDQKETGKKYLKRFQNTNTEYSWWSLVIVCLVDEMLGRRSIVRPIYPQGRATTPGPFKNFNCRTAGPMQTHPAERQDRKERNVI